MAPFLAFGAAGPYFVPFVTAVLALAVAYFLGRCLAGGADARLIGLLGAVLLACDPIFATYAIQPMSDVTATFWLITAVWLALRKPDSGSVTDGLAAGFCAGMAVLTRPALAPAAITLVAVTAVRRSRSVALAGMVCAFIAAQAALNVALYGSATSSGYGTTSHMFELSRTRLGENVWNFGKWLTYSHTPLFWLLWPGALFVLRAQKWAWQLSAVAAAATMPYLFYIIFDDWQSPRFILPAIALVLMLSAIALGRLLPDQTLRPVIIAGIAVLCAVVSHRFLEREGIGQLATLEAKYPLVGEWFRKNTSERVVVLAGLHSGPIRFYGDRQTIRWDQIPERALSGTIATLIAEGFEPYLALDAPSEPALFTARFGGIPINAQQVARVRVVSIYKFMSAY
jgi:hypothetical protein